ncbi:MAG TPA: SBBP repeat-containing protein, partial [Pyrinomonadaceae bacterium]|nr:SBBP repeat-containing protein [Pyrinomonadaceae bacterium]
MKRSRKRIRALIPPFLIVIAAALSGWGVLARRGRADGARVSRPAINTRSDERAGHGLRAGLPALQSLAFERNEGQADAGVRFLARGAGHQLLLTPRSVVARSQEGSVAFTFGGSSAASVQGEDELAGHRNYLLGNDQKRWHTEVATYRQVRYADLYPGIDLAIYGNQAEFEYDFVIKPGADPRVIRLQVDRATRAEVSRDGDLVLRRGSVELIQRKPRIYQEIGGERRAVAGGYWLAGRGEIRFRLADYDRTQPLVIDPTLVYSTFLGGGGDDSGSSIAIDSSGNVYVTGTTASLNFPTKGPLFPNNKGLSDIFITKLDPAGANIIYSTYIGGSGLDRADGIAVDGSGNAYVVGRVDSTSTDFPATVGSFGPAYRGGDFDGIVLKLNPQGSSLVYSGFLGGEENDSTEGIAVDTAGVAYVTGGTKSNTFPTTGNAYQGQRAGDTDAFLTKINAAGTGFLYSTYLGGSGTDRGSGVVIDGSGVAYLAGYGASPDFPTADSFQAGFGGNFDAFIAKIDTTQSGINSLVFSTYLGGSGDDKAFGIAADAGVNNIYVAGQTSSNNFPVLNPVQPSSGGSFDGFLAKISNTGTKVYATYFGGSGDDRATGVAVNATGVYLTGFTSSTNLPTTSPLQLNNGGAFDAFIAKLNLAGNSVLYSTYLGGTANENFVAAVTSTNPIAVDASNAYVTGYTASANFPTVSPLQPAKAAGQDAFVAKIADVTPAADFSLAIAPGARTLNPGEATNYTITATPAGGFTGTISLAVSGASNDTTTSFTPASISISDASAKSSTLTVTTTGATPPGTYLLSVTATSGNLQHSSSAQLVVAGPASANLSLTKTASPNPAITNANLTYRLIVTNNGPSPATNVVATDNLPPGVTFVSATPTQGSCSGTTTLTCNLGALARNAFAIISVVVVPQSAGTLTNNASVAGSETDPDTTDNSASLQTTVNSPSSGPAMTDPNLSVKTVVSGLSQPTSMAFIGNNDFLIFEKNTGKVQRVTNGVVQNPPPLDLAVNSGSERGGLGIALH